jgi:hypothetical protein
MSRNKSATVQIGVRLPESLRANIEKAAKQRGVSMNAEFIARIERSIGLSGLLGEVLEQMHGSDIAMGMMAAHRHGVLHFRPSDKAAIRDWLNKWVDSLPEAKK